MGFRKVIVNEAEKCPCCEGTGGLRYHVKVDISASIEWGQSTIKAEKSIHFYIDNAKQPITAKCIDCGKRVEFSISNRAECPQCSEERGKDSFGHLITPCPHCGDEVPF